MSQSITAPVFEHDQLYRMGSTQFYSGAVLNADTLEPGDYRSWAKAAFANTSNITAISIYASNGKTHLVINTKRQENLVYLAMQNDLNFAMLPIETSLGDVTPTHEPPSVDESALVTTYLNAHFWAVPSPLRVIHSMRSLAISPVVTLGVFNHAVMSPLENDVIPMRAGRKVLRSAAKRKVEVTGLYRTPIRTEQHKVRSDQFGTDYFQAEVEGLMDTAYEMGATIDDAIAIMPLVSSMNLRPAEDAPLMQVITELRGFYIAGVIV